MVLCRPLMISGSQSLWKEAQRSKFCALQRRTIVFATSWRIVTLNPEYVLATSDSSISIDADWDSLHALIEDRWQTQLDEGATEIEITSLLVAYLTQISSGASSSASSVPVPVLTRTTSLADSAAPWVVRPHAEGPVALAPPPALVLPPPVATTPTSPRVEVIPVSSPAPSLPTPSEPASQGSGLMVTTPVARAPSPSLVNRSAVKIAPKAPAVPAPAPPTAAAPAPPPPPPPPATQQQKPIEAPKSAPVQQTIVEQSTTLPSKPATTPIPVQQQMTVEQSLLLPPKPANVPPRAPSPQSKATDELIAEGKKWEQRRMAFLAAMEPVWTERRAALEKLHAQYLDQIARVAKETGFDDDPAFMEHMRAEESKSVTLAGRALFSKLSSCVNTLGEEVNRRNKAFDLDQKARLIQRVYRGWICRVHFKRLSKSLYLREKAAREVLTTERTYVESLEQMVREYLLPLRAKAVEPRSFVTPEAVAMLFSNVESIIPIHKDLLSKLEERLAHWDNSKTLLSDIFNNLAPTLKMYVQYVSAFDRSSSTLTVCLENSDFKRWHESVCQKPELKKLRLNAFLIMPVQRIPRYSLLLRELVNHTTSAHPDHDGLAKAYDMIQKVAADINEGKRDAESKQKVVEYQDMLKDQVQNLVQPHRRFMDEVMAVRDRGEDVLLVTQRKGKAILVVLDQLQLGGGEVAVLPDNASQTKWQFGLQLKTGPRVANFYMETKRERDKWVEMITKLTRTLTRGLSSLSLTRIAMQEIGAMEQSAAATQDSTRRRDRERNERHARMPENPRVQDTIDVYQEVLKLQAEIMTMPIDLRTLFPMYYQKLHPDHIARLKPRIDLLGGKLKILDQLQQRALELVKSQAIFHMLDKSITDGMDNISGMKAWVAANFGKAARIQQQQQLVGSVTPGSPVQQQAGRPIVPMSVSMSALPVARPQQPPMVAAQAQQGADPQKLMSFILMWYINLCQTWELVTETNL